MKKLFLAALVILGGFTVSACTTPINQIIGLDQNDIYAIEAISASELLTQSLLQSASTLSLAQTSSTGDLVLLDSTAGASTTTEPNENAPVVGNDLETVNKYLNMIETFLGNNNGLSVEVVASDLIDYQNKIIYTFNNILGEAVSITIYFNEILYEEPITEEETTTTTTTTGAELTTEPETTTTTEPETTTTTEPETTTTVDTTAGASTTEPLSYSPLGEAVNDENVVYSLSGIIVYSDVQYQFDGVKIVEDDEEIFRLRSYVDSLNYVRVSYKTDTTDGEQKFFYEIVVDGVVTESAKTKVSLEDAEIKVKLEYVQGLAFGQYDFKIEVVENITTIKIRYSVQNAEGVAEEGNIHIVGTYDALTDTTTYEYTILPDGKPEAHFEGDRGHKGDEEKGHHGNENGESEEEDEVENEDEIENEDELEEDEPGQGEQDRDRDHQENDDDDYRHHGGDRDERDEDESEDDESEDDEAEDDEADEDDGEVSAEEEIL